MCYSAIAHMVALCIFICHSSIPLSNVLLETQGADGCRPMALRAPEKVVETKKMGQMPAPLEHD